MKKLLVVLPLVLALVVLTLPIVGAGMDDDDPVLCVDGNWLQVVAANPAAVQVTVPEDVPFGNQHEGGCMTPAPPKARLITAVREGSEHHWMLVWINGKHASQPTVTVTYGAASRVKANDGRNALNFVFFVK
jgi:hypothetical protein